MESETQKILGSFDEGAFKPLETPVSAHCNRVPVVDGHLVTISVELDARTSETELRQAIEKFAGEPQKRKLPSAPARPLIYLDAQDRPKPRRDAERENGMAVFVGRLRPDPVFDWKLIALGHNTIRGAAGAAVLNAELMKAQGLL